MNEIIRQIINTWCIFRLVSCVNHACWHTSYHNMNYAYGFPSWSTTSMHQSHHIQGSCIAIWTIQSVSVSTVTKHFIMVLVLQNLTNWPVDEYNCTTSSKLCRRLFISRTMYRVTTHNRIWSIPFSPLNMPKVYKSIKKTRQVR